MKLGIMQPYFFPYVGYFDLINRTDSWIALDVVQYRAKSWMNRNRILHPTKGWQYISVPVIHHGRQPIKDIIVFDKAAAAKRILGQIAHYRNRAPFFDRVHGLIQQCFAGANSNTLVELNLRSLALTADYLEMPFEHQVFSKSAIDLPEIKEPGQWALEISTAFGADEYINPPDGRELFNSDEFSSRGIRLSFTDLVDYRYSCAPYAFVQHLSIIDAMMWSSPAAIKSYLDGLKASRIC